MSPDGVNTLARKYADQTRLLVLGLFAVAAVLTLGPRAAVLRKVLPEAWSALDMTIFSGGLIGRGGDLGAVPTIIVELRDPSLASLPQVLQMAVDGQAAAVVVDFDLSEPACACKASQKSDETLRAYLSSYRQPVPLIFVKRLRLQDGGLYPTESSFDALVNDSPHLSWAHARMGLDADGIVRRWVDAVTLCGPKGVPVQGDAPMLSVAMRVLHTAQWTEAKFQRAPPRAQAETCGSRQFDWDWPQSHLLFRPGPGQGPSPATVTLTPDNLRANSRIPPDVLRNNVVVIGANDGNGEDIWQTNDGAVSGVSLIADTIRFAPRQLAGGDAVSLVAVLLLVVWFTLGRIFLRKPLAWVVFFVTLGLYLLLAWSHEPEVVPTIALTLILVLQIVVADDSIELAIKAWSVFRHEPLRWWPVREGVGRPKAVAETTRSNVQLPKA